MTAVPILGGCGTIGPTEPSRGDDRARTVRIEVLGVRATSERAMEDAASGDAVGGWVDEGCMRPGEVCGRAPHEPVRTLLKVRFRPRR